MSVIVLACRGCCCGTAKHPDVDHDAQLDVLREAVGDQLEITPCLGPCRWSNVIVAVDTASGEQAWFGKVLSTEDTAAVVAWVADPSTAPRPDRLLRRPTTPDRIRAGQIATDPRRIPVAD